MRTTTKRKMPGENRKLNMLETKRRATDKKQKHQTRKKKYRKNTAWTETKIISLVKQWQTPVPGRGGGGGPGVSVEKRFHFAEHPVIE